LVDVRFGAHFGLKPDIALGPKSANTGNDLPYPRSTFAGIVDHSDSKLGEWRSDPHMPVVAFSLSVAFVVSHGMRYAGMAS